MSYKLAMMGDEMTAGVFAALGIETYIVGKSEEDIENARKSLRKMVKGGVHGAIFVTEELSIPLDDIIDEASYDYMPSIILIPDVRGSRGLAISLVRETLKKAAGRDIMAEE